jgi:hypothetical protein
MILVAIIFFSQGHWIAGLVITVTIVILALVAASLSRGY